MQPTRALAAAMIVVGVAVAAGCSSSGGPAPAPSSPPTTVVSTPPSPSGLAGQEAVLTYQRMWDAFGAAAQTSDWQSTELRRYTSGYALDQLVQSLQADQVQGVVTRGKFTTAPRVVSAQPDTEPTVVRLSDCGDDSSTMRVRAKDGTVLPGGQSGRHQIDAEVRRDHGVWTVTDFRLKDVGTC